MAAARIDFYPLVYVLVVNFMVSQSRIISQEVQLTLIDHNSQPTQKVPLNVNFRRNITLVPGCSYEVNCNHAKGGFRGRKDIWFHFNDTLVVQHLTDTTPPPVNIYAMEVDTNNWKLVLQPFQESDSGVYICRGDNSSLILDIRPGNPTVLSSTPELSIRHGVQLGSRPTLVVFVSGNPQPNGSDIIWYFNNQSLPSSILQDGNELILPSNIGFDLAGRYTCQVTTSAGTASDDFLFTVTRQPAAVLSPMDGQLVVVSDGAAMLTCSDSVGIPTPSFRWTYADNPMYRVIADDRIMILNSTNRQSPSSVLIIDPMLAGDDGWYTCTAYNDAGFSSQRIHVEVQVKPNLKPYQASSTPLRVMLGSNVTLQTLLVDANPMDVTVRWLGPSRDLIPDSQYSSFNTNNHTVYTVTVTTLTPSSEGVYTCEFENSVGTSTLNFTLVVIAPPTLTHMDGSKEVKTLITRNRGPQVTLTAYQHGSMPPTIDKDVSWSKTKFEHETKIEFENLTKYNIMKSDDLSLLSLIILSPSIEDSSLYSVTVVHETGAVNLSFQLEVLDPPLPPIMLNATPIAPCVIEVEWALPDDPLNNTAAPSFILVEASLSDSTEWTEIGYSLVNTTKSKTHLPLHGVLNRTTTVNELHLRTRSGSDAGNIGVGEYYTENTTFSFFREVPDPPILTGLRELEVSNETMVLQWRPSAPYNCTIPSEVHSTCSIISYIITCQLEMEPEEFVLLSVEVPGDETSATIILRKGETYKCSVQAQNWCQLLSNRSNSIEISIPDDVSSPTKTNAIVIIGVLFSVAALLFFSILVVYFALIAQHRRTKVTVYVTSPATPSLPQTVPDTPTNDSVHTDHEEAITYSTLKELCIQLADFRGSGGLPTGDWDQEGH